MGRAMSGRKYYFAHDVIGITWPYFRNILLGHKKTEADFGGGYYRTDEQLDIIGS